MPEADKVKDNGKLTDEALSAISMKDIEDKDKYSNEDRQRKEDMELASRLERYIKEPNAFVEISEVVVCMIKTPFGPMLRIQGNPTDLKLAWADINRKIISELNRMDIEMAMKHKSKVLQAGPSFMSGLRRFKGKR